jgi:hypothetical protein
VALDDLAREIEIAGQELANVLGSRPSDIVVKPTRSAKRTLTRRRSATRASLPVAAAERQG